MESTIPGARLQRSDGILLPGVLNLHTLDVDFGAIPTYTGTFTVQDPLIGPNSIVIVTQAGLAGGTRENDEEDMDPIIFVAVPTPGVLTLYGKALNGPVVGKYKVNYLLG